MWGINSTIPPLYVLSHWQHNEGLFLEAVRSYKPAIMDTEKEYLPMYKPRSILITPVPSSWFSSECKKIMLNHLRAPRKYNYKSTLSFSLVRLSNTDH